MKSPHSDPRSSIAYLDCRTVDRQTTLTVQTNDFVLLHCSSLNELQTILIEQRPAAICVHIDSELLSLTDILSVAQGIPLIIVVHSELEHLALRALEQGAFEYICIDRECPRTVFRLLYHSIQQFQVIQELQEMRSTTQEITTIKRRFLNHIGRELTGPVSGIVDLVDLTLQEENLDKIRENLRSIQDSAVSLQLLARDILALTEERNVERHTYKEEFDLKGEFFHALSLLAIDARHHGMQLLSDFRGRCPDKVRGDLFTYKQLIIVVISAILRLRASVKTIYIMGRSGMSHEVQHACLFSFTVSFPHEKSLKRSIETTAVDLQHPLSGMFSVAQALVEQLNGNIRCAFGDNVLQQVVITIPFAIPDSIKVVHTQEHVGSISHLRVLVADDHEINRRVLQRWLELRGHKVLLAQDGQEAIELCAAEPFDLILMDIQMPKVDGLQAAKEIRARIGTFNNHLTPFYAVSAHLSEDSERIERAEGIDGIFHKPLHFPLLEELIDQIQIKKNTILAEVDRKIA